MVRTLSRIATSAFRRACHPVVLALILMAIGSLDVPGQSVVVTPITGLWRYTTNNLDGVNWMAPAYDESAWYGPGTALLFIENSTTIPAPLRTPLPARLNGSPAPTYYFRSTFLVTNLAGVTLVTFSNLIDDGAIFYLNGKEVQRIRMAAGPPSYASLTTGTTPSGDAQAFEIFYLSGNALTNLVEGVNHVAAEVHQSDTNNVDIVFGAAIAVDYGELGVALKRGPYLQSSTPTNITICWRTDRPASSRVIFGTNPASLLLTNDDTSRKIDHFLTLAGLQPDSRYYYAVGTTNSFLAGPTTNHFFHTHPWPGLEKPIRVWVVGDSGTGTASQTAVRDAFYNYNGTNTVNAWLLLGDNAYNNGTDSEYQTAVFSMYSSLLTRSVPWPTLGNHDTAQGTAFVDAYPYFSIFHLPTAGQAGGVPSGTEHYYAFDIGMAHFICLDSMTASRALNGAMADWLRLDLAINTNRWTVAYWHHPPYTKGSHDSDYELNLVEMRQNILPILEAGGVDLVLAGHSHSYERSCLIDGHYGPSWTFATNTMITQPGSGRETNGAGAYLKPDGMGVVPEGNRGAIYAVAGSSGSIGGGPLNHPAMYSSQNVLGSMVLDFASNRLDAIFLPTSGIPTDWFSIVKVAAHPPRLGRLQANSAGPMQFTIWCRQNTTNVVERTAALDGPVNWSPIATNVPTLPAFIYSDTNPPAGPRRFYRVRQE